MVLLLITYTVECLVVAALVGVTWFAVLRSRKATVSPKMSLVSLLGVFAFLDLYWRPALLALDITFTVKNPEVAAFFKLSPNMRSNEVLGIGSTDCVVWIIQVLVALWVGHKVVGSYENQAT